MICCVTGHRPKGFPFERKNSTEYDIYMEKLRFEIETLIMQGYDHFISGMAEGADIDFAEVVAYYRDMFLDVTLEAALPYPKHPTQKSSEYLDDLYSVLENCDTVNAVSDRYFRGCMQKRNRYMVDKSDLVLAIWNGEYAGGTWDTIKYARSKGKPIKYIMLRDINGKLLEGKEFDYLLIAPDDSPEFSPDDFRT